MLTQQYLNRLSYKVIGCAIEVHKNLGPGLLESVYQSCLSDELKSRGIRHQSQVTIPVLYKGKDLGGKLKIDLLIEDILIVELKAVETILPLHQAQLLSYLKLTRIPKGLLINFNCETIREDLISLVTDEFAKLPEE